MGEGKALVANNLANLQEELVGSKIKVWRPLDEKFYEGVVTHFDPKKHTHEILYDDGKIEHLHMAEEYFQIVNRSKAFMKGSSKKRIATFKRPSREEKAKKQTANKGPTPRVRPRLSFEWEWPERFDFVSKLRGLKRKKMKTHFCPFSRDDLKKQIRKTFKVDGLDLWNDQDLMVMDKNGEPILYYLKDGLERPFKDRDPVAIGFRALQKFIEKYPPPKPAIFNVRHKGSLHPEGHGVHHLAPWHVVNHKNDPRVPSKDVIKSG